MNAIKAAAGPPAVGSSPREVRSLPAVPGGRAVDGQERFAAALADYLTAVADHWATITTLANRTGDQRLRVYAAAVEAEADVRAAWAQAIATDAPRDELASIFQLLTRVVARQIAAYYQAGQPDRPHDLIITKVALARTARAARRSVRLTLSGRTRTGRAGSAVRLPVLGRAVRVEAVA